MVIDYEEEGSIWTKAAQEIQQVTGNQILAVPADVTKEEEIAAIVTATIKEFGSIDILVNNAGGPPFGIFETVSDGQWRDAFEQNLLSAVR
jgi:3-oxoacyl-[acyl-carrier protein] reductase